MIEICNDFDYIRSVIFEPEMWERSKDDYSVQDDSILNNCVWLKCYHDDKAVGLVCLKSAGNVVINIHIHIPKENRGMGTIAVGLNALKWVKAHVDPMFKKLNTKVPVIYKDVIMFAHCLGFEDEGIDRASIMKSGKLVDRLNLGLLIEDIL